MGLLEKKFILADDRRAIMFVMLKRILVISLLKRVIMIGLDVFSALWVVLDSFVPG
jgi:hypothetical protein